MTACANDEAEFSGFLRSVFGTDDVSLERLSVGCTMKVYRLTVNRTNTYFCKRTRISQQMAVFLRALPDASILVPLIVKEPLEFKGEAVLVYAWKTVRSIPIVEMDDGQFASFLKAAKELFSILGSVDGGRPPQDEREWWGIVSGYVGRHPFLGKAFKGLLAEGVSAYAYSPDAVLSVCHGDFHTDNFGFAEDGQFTFMDFDLIVKALPAEDLTHLIVNAMRHGRLIFDRVLRNRLFGRYEEMIRSFDFPLSDWRLALGRERLMTAAMMINRRGDTARPAWEFLRRDWTVRKMYEVLGDA